MGQERFLMHKDGTIHSWNEWLAGEAGMTEATEEQAYPERFVKGGKRAAKVSLAIEESEPPPTSNEVNLLSGEQAGKHVEAKHGFTTETPAKAGKGFHK